MISASACARRAGYSLRISSGLASALTRSRVWKVETSGTPSSCWLIGGDESNRLMFLQSTDGGTHWVPATGTVTTPPGAASYADGGAYLQCIGALHCWGQWTLYTGLGGNELTVPFSTVDGHDWTYETAPASVSTFASLSCMSTSETTSKVGMAANYRPPGCGSVRPTPA